MPRPQFSSSVIVQKTLGEKLSSVNETITTTEKTISFPANLISYLINDGSYDLTVKFFNDGVKVGEMLMGAGYGMENTYLQVDEIKAVTTAGETTLKGVGVA